MDRVRGYLETNSPDTALDLAIDSCISDNILEEFLRLHWSEVKRVSMLDYTFERRMELAEQESREKIGKLMSKMDELEAEKDQLVVENELLEANENIEGVEKIQLAMQDKIAELGIAVEANPSSNYLISTMEGYEDHPIINLFNMGLTVNHKEIQRCPQLHISINTDDKGVFHTSLENEFALMAYALEDMKTGKGKKRYPRQMVYDWLDHVRQNGNQQSFQEWLDAEEYE